MSESNHKEPQKESLKKLEDQESAQMINGGVPPLFHLHLIQQNPRTTTVPVLMQMGVIGVPHQSAPIGTKNPT